LLVHYLQILTSLTYCPRKLETILLGQSRFLGNMKGLKRNVELTDIEDWAN